MPRPYVLLDRDGTVIVERNYLATVEGLQLLPGAAEGLRLLSDAGFGLVIVTNQSGLARGKFTRETLESIHAELVRRLRAEGVLLDGIYYCPHAPGDGCECRKPKTLLARQAAAELGFELSDAVMIGDKPADVEFGRNAGMRTILVRTGYGAEHAASTAADYVAADLLDAARHITTRMQIPTR